MRFTHWTIGEWLELSPQHPYVFVIEHPKTYYGILRDLSEQLKGNNGDCALLRKGNQVKFGDYGAIILDYVNFSSGEKRILSAVQKVFKKQLVEMNEPLQHYIAEGWEKANVWAQGNTLPVTVQMPSILDFYKWFPLSVEEPETLVERIAQYMDALSEYCVVELLVFANLKSVTDQSEREKIYAHAEYRGISLLLIEPYVTPNEGNEKTVLVDKDLCLVYHKSEL